MNIIKYFLKTILIIIFSIYFIIILLLSVFILSENKYGITEIKDYVFVLVNENNKSQINKENMLIIVKKCDFGDIKIDDEVYVYESNVNNNIFINSGNVSKIVNGDEDYIELENKNAIYRTELIVGKPYKKIDKIGGIILFLENKWIFLTIAIFPIAILCLYEIVYIFKNYTYDENEFDENIEEY